LFKKAPKEEHHIGGESRYGTNCHLNGKFGWTDQIHYRRVVDRSRRGLSNRLIDTGQRAILLDRG
jgi:hypothetical protein